MDDILKDVAGMICKTSCCLCTRIEFECSDWEPYLPDAVAILKRLQSIDPDTLKAAAALHWSDEKAVKAALDDVLHVVLGEKK